MNGCLANAERRWVISVVMIVLYLLFIVVFKTSFICNKMQQNVTYVMMVICLWQELGEEGERRTL